MQHNPCSEPTQFLPKDACQVAVGLINAQLAGITGNQAVRVKIGDRETWFNHASADPRTVKAEVLRWCQLCQTIDPATAEAAGINAYMKSQLRSGVAHLPTTRRIF